MAALSPASPPSPASQVSSEHFILSDPFGALPKDKTIQIREFLFASKEEAWKPKGLPTSMRQYTLKVNDNFSLRDLSITAALLQTEHPIMQTENSVKFTDRMFGLVSDQSHCLMRTRIKELNLRSDGDLFSKRHSGWRVEEHVNPTLKATISSLKEQAYNIVCSRTVTRKKPSQSDVRAIIDGMNRCMEQLDHEKTLICKRVGYQEFLKLKDSFSFYYDSCQVVVDTLTDILALPKFIKDSFMSVQLFQDILGVRAIVLDYVNIHINHLMLEEGPMSGAVVP